MRGASRSLQCQGGRLCQRLGQFVLNLMQIIRFSRGCCLFPIWDGAVQSKRGQIALSPPRPPLDGVLVTWHYRQLSNIRLTKPQSVMFLVSSCSCLCAIYWSQVLSRKWRCSWSSADRLSDQQIYCQLRCVTYIRDLTVYSNHASNMTTVS